MIYISDYLEAIDMQITGGSPHYWKCYGENTRFLKCDSIDNHGGNEYSSYIIFSPGDPEVRELTVCDHKNDRAYIWMHPDYKEACYKEAEERNLGHIFKYAWDDVPFIHTQDEKDILTKVNAIVNGEGYDPRVVVTLEIDDDTLFMLMLEAHKKDITLNHHVEEIVYKEIAEELEIGKWI